MYNFPLTCDPHGLFTCLIEFDRDVAVRVSTIV
jgi:hypothetical protein